MQDLIIMGAGGLAAETYEWISDYTEHSFSINFYADFTEQEKLYGIPISTDLSKFSNSSFKFITAVGSPTIKDIFYNKAISFNIQPCDPIYTTRSIISKSVKLQPNTMVSPNATVTARTLIGHSATIHYGCTIGHDCKIGNFFTALPGSNISGNVTIGNYVTVGANASIREKLYIAHNVFIGMGSVVVKNIEESGVYVGNPAKRIRSM